MFYTYLWLRYDGTPYYVGKGKLRRALNSDNHNVRRPRNPNFIVLQTWNSNDEAIEAEKLLISYFGRLDLGTGVLRNRTEGGEGS